MKKLFTKVMAILSATCMLPVASVFADNTDAAFTLDEEFKYTPASWVMAKDESGYKKDAYINAGGTLKAIPEYNYAEVVLDQGLTGNALALNWEDAEIGNVSIRIRQENLTLDEGKYNLTFWAKGDKISNVGIGFLGTPSAYRALPNASMKTGETNGDWIEYSAVLDLTNDDEDSIYKGSFQIVVQRGYTNTLIDDVVLKAIDENGEVTGDNILADGGFENVKKAERNLAENNVVASDWKMTDASIIDDSEHWIAVDRAFGRTDNSSLYVHGKQNKIVNQDGTTTWQFFAINGSHIKLEAGKKYDLTFYIKNNGKVDAHVNICGDSKPLGNAYTITTENGWTKYTRVIDWSAKTADTYGTVVVNAYTTPDFWLDDLTVTEQGTDKNLVANSSFTDYEKIPKTAVGDTKANGWNVGYGAGTTNTNKEEYLAKCGKTIFAETSDSEARSGSRSMLMVYPDARQGHSSVSITAPVNLSAGEYTLTFYAKGSYINGGVEVICRDTSGFKELIWLNNTQNNKGITFKDISLDGEWKKYQFKILASGERNGITILVDNLVDYIYIDDISLTDANGVEYITNGGFEDITKINISEIKNFMAYPAFNGNAANVSWENPKNDDISLKLYVDGVEDTNFAAADYTASESFNEYLLTDLTNWKNYKIKLELTIGDKTTSYETNVIPRPGEMSMNNWKVSRHDGKVNEVQNYANITTELIRDGGYESNGAVLVNSNRQGAIGSNYSTLYQKIAVDTTKPYEFKFKAKIDNKKSAKSLGIILDSGSSKYWIPVNESDVTDVDVTITPLDNGWTEYSYVIEPLNWDLSQINFRIKIEDWADSIILDNIELYELDPNNGYVAVGENLVTDGDFELPDFIVNTPTIGYYNAEAEAWLEDIDVTWGEGKYKAQVVAQNLFGDAYMPLTLILAGYDEDGKLVNVVPFASDVPNNQWAASTFKAEGDFAEGCTLKAMVWQGKNWSMIPLTDSNTVYPEAE